MAGIAIPQYTASIRQSNIRTLQPAMQAFAHGMERFHNENLTFVGTSAAVPGAPLPGIYPSQWPQQGTAYFNLTVQAAAGSSYTIRATPIAGTPLATVGMMELDATGARRWDKNNDGDFADVGENNWDQ
ncbi:MAG: general secretion pathway protein GspH [Gammaproteobacteria bacterium]|nr:general secretion pathway protein GspH [Gammaproteobacteria bacterium]MDH5803087.1 general secretion pathway protein GspH [Gammaproteobacteria bacterium]